MKRLSNFLQAELKGNGWENSGTGMLDGYVFATNGKQIHIVPSKMGKMYHLTEDKMSVTSSSFVTEAQLLKVITDKGE